MNRNTVLKAILAVPALTLTALAVHAGGPLNLNPNDPGNLERWPDGGRGIPFHTDGVPAGGATTPALGSRTHAQAVADVLTAFRVWQDVPTATAAYANHGPMPFDIDASNYAPFIENLAFGTNVADGYSPIVLDRDGSIFFSLFGFFSGVLGFATTDVRDDDGNPIEGVAFFNGGMTDLFERSDVVGLMVHEFGHLSGMAHSVVNGQNILLGDETGPSPFHTYGDAPQDQVETMYPFLIEGGGFESLHADDVAFFSVLYPADEHAASSGSIRGTILAPNGTTPLTGVNVIARNVDDPFADAVSAISGDRGIDGQFTIDGLTPGARYTVQVDQILAGGFSTKPIFLPGYEEFFNGDRESNNATSPDPPADSTALTPTPDGPIADVDIVVNGYLPEEPLPVGEFRPVNLFLPFEFEMCGRTYSSLFVNAHGNLTFGAPDGFRDFLGQTTALLEGPPRIAPVFDALDPALGGAVTFDQTPNTFRVQYTGIPLSIEPERKSTFEVTLNRGSNHVDISYGEVDSFFGIAGISCGGADTSGFETTSDLSRFEPAHVNLHDQPAEFEVLTGDQDLAYRVVRFNGTTDYRDGWAEPNDTVRNARSVALPFESRDPRTDYTTIDPIGGDVDHFRFEASAGETLVADIIAGNLDSYIGLFRIEGQGSDRTATLLSSDDDGGFGLRSRIVHEIPETGTYAVAVTTQPDVEFEGTGRSGGRYVLRLRTVQPRELQGSVFAVDGMGSRIVELDAATGRLLGSIPTPVPASPFENGLAHSGNSLYFIAVGSDTIYEIDPSTGVVRNSFHAPVAPLAFGANPDLGFSDGVLFTASASTQFRVDPATGEVLGSCEQGRTSAGGLAGGSGRTFGGLLGRGAAEIDPVTCDLVGAPFGVVAEGSLFPLEIAIGLASDGTNVFSVGLFADTIRIVDPETGVQLGSISPGFIPTGLAAPER